MRVVHTAFGDKRHFDASGGGQRRESLVVGIPDRQAVLVDPVRLLELRPEIGRVHVAGEIAGAVIDPGIFVHLPAEKAGAVRALLAEDLRGVVVFGIPDHQGAALSHGVVFRLVEGVAAEIADRAQRASLVEGHDALRRVLDDLQAVPRGDVEDRVHLAGDAGVVYRHDGPRAVRDSGLDLLLIEVHRVRADVDEDRRRVREHDGRRRAGERKARDNDFVPFLQSAQKRRHLQRRRAARRKECLLRAETLLDKLMAFFCELTVAADLVCVDGLFDIG